MNFMEISQISHGCIEFLRVLITTIDVLLSVFIGRVDWCKQVNDEVYG